MLAGFTNGDGGVSGGCPHGPATSGVGVVGAWISATVHVAPGACPAAWLAPAQCRSHQARVPHLQHIVLQLGGDRAGGCGCQLLQLALLAALPRQYAATAPGPYAAVFGLLPCFILDIPKI